jgi:hypothetical protein
MAVLVAVALAPARAQDTTDEVVRLVNQERAARGIAALVRNSSLDAAARRHSDDMANGNFFSHTGSDGSSAGDRIFATGYRWIAYGENIAAGHRTPAEVVAAWMNSDGHRRNILDPGFKEIGVALVLRPGTTYGYYWTQEFGLRLAGASSSVPTPTPPPAPTPAPTPTPTPTPTGKAEILSITPKSGLPGTHVILRGNRFGRSGTVRFNGLTATRVRWSDTEVEVIVPEGAKTGLVTVSTAYGTATGPTFTVPVPGETPPLAPTPPGTPSVPSGTPLLTKVTPDRGPAGGTVTRVLITGESLGTGGGLSSIIVPATVRVISWSDTKILLELSAPSIGGLRLRVRRSDGRISNSLIFLMQ